MLLGLLDVSKGVIGVELLRSEAGSKLRHVPYWNYQRRKPIVVYQTLRTAKRRRRVSGTGLAVGGSSDPSAPAAGYVDYLDRFGVLLVATGTTPPAGWFYERVWQISSPSTNLKQVTVVGSVRSSFQNGVLPQSTVVALKTFPF
jgi:hypothetical protein